MPPAPLAYKYVLVAAMLAEANWTAVQLRLPLDLPIAVKDIRRAYLPDPRTGIRGAGGCIDTSKYSFCFPDGGLRYIVNLANERGDMSVAEWQLKISRLRSNLSTNDAYVLAKQWLKAIDVDVERLELEKHVETRQWASYNWPDPTNTVTYFPLYDVVWGDWTEPAVSVEISATNGSLLHLRQEDRSYSKRPAGLITNLEALLRIPDQDFRSYSAQQRSNLVLEFAAFKNRGQIADAPRPRPPKAFEHIAVSAMMAEASRRAAKLGLPGRFPLVEEQLTEKYVVNPELVRFGGRLGGAGYSFGFGPSERLCSVTRAGWYEWLTRRLPTGTIVGGKPSIDRKQASRLARHWLELASVDVTELERTNHVLTMGGFWVDFSTGTWQARAAFEVSWGNLFPKASVCIDGRTKELLNLTVWDESLSRERGPLIRDREELLRISDEEFLSYTRAQKDALVTRFVAQGASR